MISLITSAALGAVCGFLSAPLPDAIVAARLDPAGDAYREARVRIGAWTIGVGSIVMVASVTPSMLPAIAITVGVLLLATTVGADLRERAWIARVRAGRAPGWTIAPADDSDFDLAPLWSHDDLADEVLIEHRAVEGDPYRSPLLRRAIGRVSSADTPRAIRSRLTLAIAAIAVSGLLVGVSLLRGDNVEPEVTPARVRW